VAAAVKEGPQALSPRQKLVLLGDPAALHALHQEVSMSPAAHPAWLAGREARETPRVEAAS
jgi:membrane glycosyltransferase